MRILSIFALVLMPSFALANGIGGVVDSPSVASLLPPSKDGPVPSANSHITVVDSQALTRLLPMTTPQKSLAQSAISTPQPK